MKVRPAILLLLVLGGRACFAQTELQHFVLGLTPSTGLQVVWNGLSILTASASDPAGSLSFPDRGPGAYLVGPLSGGDGSAPAPVHDLAVSGRGWDRLRLSWTATGDHGHVGRADHYLLRLDRTPVREEDWVSAVPVSEAPRPDSAGSRQDFWVTGLEPSTVYYFSLRVVNRAGSQSLLSNPVRDSTEVRPPPSPPDPLPPAPPDSVRGTWNGEAIPNPTSGAVRILYSLRHQGTVRWTLYDLSGRPLLSSMQVDVPPGRQEWTLDLNGIASANGPRPLRAGIYFLRFESDSMTRSTKLILIPR